MDIEINTEIRPKFPQHYQQIYTSYTSKNYEKCINIIEKVNEHHIEYKILNAACLIHLGKDIPQAHEILDGILLKNPENPVCLYAKGLAYYYEGQWNEAADAFLRAREIDPSPDLERAEIMRNKALQKIAEGDDSRLVSTPPQRLSPQETGASVSRRFGCEICGHFFGKKFNLDRHNRSIHKRDTPEDFPRGNIPKEVDENEPEAEPESEQVGFKPEPTQDSAVSVTFMSPQPPNKPLKKKITKQSSLNLFGMKNRVKCNYCKKSFKRGSLSRHMIIHTGKKRHECTTCHRSFFQRSDLMRHETIHSDVMAFECEVCSKKFRLKKNLQVHKRRYRH